MIAPTDKRRVPQATRALTAALVLLPGVILALAGLLTLRDTALFWNPLRFHAGDVWEYYRVGPLLRVGLMPYRDFPLEYPPLAVVAFLLPLAGSLGRAVSYPHYCALLVGANAVLGALLALTLSRTALLLAPVGGAPRRPVVLAWYALFILLLCPLVPWRFDLFPALLTLLALRAALRGRTTEAGLWLGFGGAAKLYPLVLIPVFLAYYAAQGERRSALRLLLGAAGALAASVLPFLAAGRAMLGFVQYHQHRGLELESLPAGLLLLAHDLTKMPLGWIFNFGAFHMVTPLSAPILRLLPLAALLALGGVLVGAVRRFRADRAEYGAVRPESLVTFLLAMLLAFVATNKVFSPQYLIWLFPFAPLLRPRVPLVVAVLCVLTIILFPFCIGDLLQGRPWIVAVLNGRNFLVLALCGALVWSRRAAPPCSARPVVPTIGATALAGTMGE